MSLEMRYRRLLAVYPAQHREAYADEMTAVLMDGARPGQRRPSLREAADLLWCGLAARARGAVRSPDPGRREAAGIAGLIGAVMLAAVAVRRLLMYASVGFVEGGQVRDVAVRALVWTVVAAVVLAGLRRTAAALAVLGVLVETAAIVVWLPGEAFRPIRMSWALALSLLTAVFLVVARRARRPVASSVPAMLGVRRAPAGARGRVAVLLAPLVAVPVAQPVLESVIGIHAAPAVTAGIVLADVAVMAGLPLLALGLALAARRATAGLRLTRTGAAGHAAPE
ncbi:hypothetical protein COUCH_22485 [Couchioplanes caeruleus]|uniref:hypothetical protein n=1 Tax=Couchioplanes caeruleus TaxID=56438 RepID=UPI0020BF69E3|nr:hypothetical protein [Couchioplanes caeruleus]UQU61809.1 hypothetical protein COUCH_22485 [Couchioplanes caeruleus]